MAERPSKVRTKLPCPECGRTLFPSPVDSGVTFHCKSGHGFPLRDLLAAQSTVLKGGLEGLLDEWIRLYEALIDSAEDARKNGFLDIAEIFHHQAKSLGSRIGKVRDAFSQSGSTKPMNVPEVHRSADQRV